jgi:hypothetical protein
MMVGSVVCLWGLVQHIFPKFVVAEAQTQNIQNISTMDFIAS